MWKGRKFLGPAKTAEMLRDPTWGFKASRAASAKLPRAFHLLMRVNRQVRARCVFRSPARSSLRLRPLRMRYSLRLRILRILRILLARARANRQCFALFQMQYGVSPTMRYEYIKLMTRSALLGLAFDAPGAGSLPEPGPRLATATKAFFDRERPRVDARMAAEFRWDFPDVFVPQAGGDFVKARMRRRAAGGGAREKAAEQPITPLRI